MKTVEELTRIMMTDETLKEKFADASEGGGMNISVDEIYEKARTLVPEINRAAFEGKVKNVKELIAVIKDDEEVFDRMKKITSMAAGYEIVKTKLPDLCKDEYLNAMKALTAISQSADNDDMLSDDDLEMAAGGLSKTADIIGAIGYSTSFVAGAALGAAAL